MFNNNTQINAMAYISICSLVIHTSQLVVLLIGTFLNYINQKSSIQFKNKWFFRLSPHLTLSIFGILICNVIYQVMCFLLSYFKEQVSKKECNNLSIYICYFWILSNWFTYCFMYSKTKILYFKSNDISNNIAKVFQIIKVCLIVFPIIALIMVQDAYGTIVYKNNNRQCVFNMSHTWVGLGMTLMDIILSISLLVLFIMPFKNVKILFPINKIGMILREYFISALVTMISTFTVCIFVVYPSENMIGLNMGIIDSQINMITVLYMTRRAWVSSNIVISQIALSYQSNI